MCVLPPKNYLSALAQAFSGTLGQIYLKSINQSRRAFSCIPYRKGAEILYIMGHKQGLTFRLSALLHVLVAVHYAHGPVLAASTALPRKRNRSNFDLRTPVQPLGDQKPSLIRPEPPGY
jgi:hypothetical protein